MTPAVRWRAFVNTAFSTKYLLYTNCALSVGLSGECIARKHEHLRARAGAGDVLQQTVLHMRDPNRPISARRTFNMSVSSLSFGVLSHYWCAVHVWVWTQMYVYRYIWLDRRFVGRTIRTVLIKVALDQVILSPIMWIVQRVDRKQQNWETWNEFCKNVLRRIWLTVNLMISRSSDQLP
jgi:hypothetical protein